MAMVNWRARKILKRNKGSQTAGKTKGENCSTDAQKKFFFSSSKAYKHRDYERWHQLAKRLNTGSKV